MAKNKLPGMKKAAGKRSREEDQRKGVFNMDVQALLQAPEYDFIRKNERLGERRYRNLRF